MTSRTIRIGETKNRRFLRYKQILSSDNLIGRKENIKLVMFGRWWQVITPDKLNAIQVNMEMSGFCLSIRIYP